MDKKNCRCDSDRVAILEAQIECLRKAIKIVLNHGVMHRASMKHQYNVLMMALERQERMAQDD